MDNIRNKIRSTRLHSDSLILFFIYPKRQIIDQYCTSDLYNFIFLYY